MGLTHSLFSPTWQRQPTDNVLRDGRVRMQAPHRHRYDTSEVIWLDTRDETSLTDGKYSRGSGRTPVVMNASLCDEKSVTRDIWLCLTTSQ